MRTLLVRPFTEQGAGDSPPLSLMYLSSYLKSKQLNVKLIDKCVNRKLMGDFSPHNSYIQDLVQDIKDYEPDIIGMTLFSRELREIAILCKLLKKRLKSTLIILGGPHPTAMPQESLEQIPECDIVVRGEGELVLYDIISTLSDNNNLQNVKGISFRLENKNEIYHCEDADIITDLDTLPFPDREGLIHNYRNGNYSSILYGIPTDIMMTSRGCPFQCHFCFKVCAKYRRRSPENVLNEIDRIVEYTAPEYVQIMDDSFTVRRESCIKILDALIEKKYPCKFKVRSRVDAVDVEILKKMKKAGVDTVVYGLESGSQKMLNSFNKKTTVEQNVSACKLTRKAGLNCIGDMILFYPGETKETLKETQRFTKYAKPTAVRYFILTPLPKTRVYEEAKKNGRLMGAWGVGEQIPWVKLDEFESVQKMEKITKRMFIKTFLSPYRIFWIMKSYGKCFIKNPAFFVKRAINLLWEKRKY